MASYGKNQIILFEMHGNVCQEEAVSLHYIPRVYEDTVGNLIIPP
jgi:hypothetical protein